MFLSSKPFQILAVFFLFLLFSFGPLAHEALAQGAVTGSVATDGSNTKATMQQVDFGCGLLALDACIVSLTYKVVYGASEIFFSFGGFFLDGFMAMALSSTFIRNTEFVDFGWIIVRDLANTAFIFVLLYIAIMTIVQAASTNTKQLLVSLIIAALFVNFSLYLTRFVIDASNIVALEFYNHIGTSEAPLVTVDGIEARSISAGFLKVNIQETTTRAHEFSMKNEHTKAFAIIVLGAILNVVGFFMLLSAAFLFLGRVVALWLVMIFSPLAVVASIVPGANNLWGKWKSALINQSLVAPVFLFFLYLTFAFLKSPLINAGLIQVSSSASAGGQAAGILFGAVAAMMNFVVAFVLLGAGLAAARNFAGAAGQMAEKWGKGAFGTVVLGGAAWAAKNTVGRGMRRMSETETGQKFQRGLERSGVARFVGLDKAMGKITEGTYDARGLRGIQAAIGASGTAGAFGQAGKGHVEGLAKEQKLRQDQYNKLKGDPAAQARYFNSLSFREKQFIHKNLGVAEQLSLHEEVRKLPDYNDRAWHDLGGSPREHMEEFERKQAALAPKTGIDLEIERAKQTKATLDPTTGAITQFAEDKRLTQLAGLTDPNGAPDLMMQRKVLAALSARDIADLHQRAGVLGGASPLSQSALTRLVEQMNTEEQEKFHSEMIKREANVANQLTHFIGITDQTVMQNVFNNMNTDLRSKLFHGARAAGGAAQTTLTDRISGLNPAERLNTEQSILKRFTGATADADLTERIAEIFRTNAQLAQEVWTGTDVRVRAQALESGAPAVAQLQTLEDALPQAEKDRTSDFRVEVRQAKDAIVHRSAVESAVAGGVLPAGVTRSVAIKTAIGNLKSKQIARLAPTTLIDPDVMSNLKLQDLKSIATREEVNSAQLGTMVDDFVRRQAIPPVGAPISPTVANEMRQLKRDTALMAVISPERYAEVVRAAP